MNKIIALSMILVSSSLLASDHDQTPEKLYRVPIANNRLARLTGHLQSSEPVSTALTATPTALPILVVIGGGVVWLCKELFVTVVKGKIEKTVENSPKDRSEMHRPYPPVNLTPVNQSSTKKKKK